MGGVDEYLLLDAFFAMKFSMNLAEMVLVGAMKFPSPLEATERKIEKTNTFQYEDIYTWQMFHCYDNLYTE